MNSDIMDENNISEIAIKMANDNREISISEFFEKNRHLLGYDSKTKALLTCVKEAIDNSLDATIDSKILPDIHVRLKNIKDDIFNIAVKDNGPGIVQSHVPRIFGKLLYGSKFHRLKQTRGQQGIGISGVVLYSQLTTGKPTKIQTSIGDGKVHDFEIMIDIVKNEPEVIKHTVKDGMWHGIRVETNVVGRYIGGKQSVKEFLKETSIANPFARIVFNGPNEKKIFPRVMEELPSEAKEINPHLHGVELGIFKRMLNNTETNTLLNFLTKDFSRVGAQTAKKICKASKLDIKSNPREIKNIKSDKLWNVIQKTKLIKPSTLCLSPIGEDVLSESLKKQFKPEFLACFTRPPAVYRGIPFLVEVAIAFGGEIKNTNVIRFANKVPLLYQSGDCAIVKAISSIDWRRYKLEQPSGKGVPNGPIVIVVHMCSMWSPFTSESKNAIASYPMIIKEIRLSLQNCARKFKIYTTNKRNEFEAERRQQRMKRYFPIIADSISTLTNNEKQEIFQKLEELI